MRQTAENGFSDSAVKASVSSSIGAILSDRRQEFTTTKVDADWHRVRSDEKMSKTTKGKAN